MPACGGFLKPQFDNTRNIHYDYRVDMNQFENRKGDHLRLALDDRFDAIGLNGLDRIKLAHEALPELDFSEINLQTDFFGYQAASPLFISSMTAGHRAGEELNKRLIKAAATHRWPMGVGSQRRELTDPEAHAEWTRVRAANSDACLFANLGLSQLIQTPVAAVEKIVDNLQARAFIVHTNPLQEALQPEGTPYFRNGLNKIEEVCKALSIPVILKETGCGFSRATLEKLANTGLAAVDISGFGGTHWGRIEGGRAPANSKYAQAAAVFSHWGVSTVDSLLEATAVKKDVQANWQIWASGGIRSGLDAAKCIALGASAVGLAKPVLQAASHDYAALEAFLQQMEFECKIAYFCTGSKTTTELQQKARWQKI